MIQIVTSVFNRSVKCLEEGGDIRTLAKKILHLSTINGLPSNYFGKLFALRSLVYPSRL